MHFGIHLGQETEWTRLLLKGVSRFLSLQEDARLTPLPMLPDRKLIGSTPLLRDFWWRFPPENWSP